MLSGLPHAQMLAVFVYTGLASSVVVLLVLLWFMWRPPKVEHKKKYADALKVRLSSMGTAGRKPKQGARKPRRKRGEPR